MHVILLMIEDYRLKLNPNIDISLTQYRLIKYQNFYTPFQKGREIMYREKTKLGSYNITFYLKTPHSYPETRQSHKTELVMLPAM